MGALVARDIPDPNDPIVLAAMAALLARLRQDPLDDVAPSRRLGWHLPLPIAERLKVLVHHLQESHHALRPSATALLTALIWYEIDANTTAGAQATLELVTGYYQAWERPNYQLIAP